MPKAILPEMTASPFSDDDVDPEIRDWLTQMAAASKALGSGPDTPLAELRSNAELQRKPWRSGGPAMHASEDRVVGASQTRIRIHRPNDSAVLPVLVYLHGGGWTLFSIDTHDRLMREYAARAGVAVVGIDYPLSPEHRFPRALDAIDDVLGWLQREGGGLGLDAGRYALGGDSAGANLSVATAIRQRDSQLPLPRALLLNYGAFDGAMRASFERYGDADRYMLTGAEMDGFWVSYLGAAPMTDPLARPLHAGLCGLPPTWLCVAQCDVLLDENVEMAQRLAASGVPTDLRIYEGATHSFLEAAAISRLAVRAIDEASQWLAARLS